jgi:N-acetylmuramate 1-kinase
MTTRNQQLQHWVQTKTRIDEFIALRYCASFRRYFRVVTNGRCLIAVDASLEKDACAAFVQQTNYLLQYNLTVPRIIAQDKVNGFLLVEDFGDERLDRIVTPSNAAVLYRASLDALATFNQLTPKPVGRYLALDESLVHEEMRGFRQWYLEKLCHKVLSEAQCDVLHEVEQLLQAVIGEQPRVFIHRDYQSQNIMRIDQERIGILDFQDAMVGPVTYDVASLLHDCYQHWPQERIIELALYYKQKMPRIQVDDGTFLRWFDLMSVQRLLKCLFTFARKSCRDQDDDYLQYIPNTVGYIAAICKRYVVLEPLIEVLA